MKVSKEQMAENRARILDAAAALFRERGFAGIGVADLMKAAGLTHGGFYGHFASKEELMARASERALAGSLGGWRGLVEHAPDDALRRIVRSYLSEAHRDHPEQGCREVHAVQVVEGRREVMASLDECVARPNLVGQDRPAGTGVAHQEERLRRQAEVLHREALRPAVLVIGHAPCRAPTDGGAQVTERIGGIQPVGAEKGGHLVTIGDLSRPPADRGGCRHRSPRRGSVSR